MISAGFLMAETPVRTVSAIGGRWLLTPAGDGGCRGAGPLDSFPGSG